jgi:ankyrin repeat protein
LRAITHLLTLGVNPNAANPVNGWTPLLWAAKRGNVQAARTLLMNGASKDCVSNKGETVAGLAKTPELRKLLGLDVIEELAASESAASETWRTILATVTATGVELFAIATAFEHQAR